MASIQSHTRRLASASALLFVLHLPHLLIVRGEFTDGVLQSVYFDEPIYLVAEGAGPAKYVPPFYPFSLYTVSLLGVDRITAGRLVSMAAYSFTAFALGWFATGLGRRMSHEGTMGQKIGWLAWVFWALSPMANRWSFHCMSDMLFCCLATLALVSFLEATRRRARDWKVFWGIGNLVGVTASLCRYQGLALLGASAVGLFAILWGSKRRQEADWAIRKSWLGGSCLAWVVCSAYLFSESSIHGKQFAERSQFPTEVYTGFALAAFRYLPYAVTPPLFLLALWGGVKAWRFGRNARIWILLGVLGGIGGLVIQTLFQSFQFRYGLPLLPWICVIGAIGVVTLPKKFQVPAAGVALVWLAVMSGAVIVYQHETFGDIEEASRAAGFTSQSSGGKVWAREPYDNDGKYRNVKTSVWSGRPVRWLDGLALEEVAPGDVLIDSNVYPILDSFLASLREKWRLAVIEEALSETIPLFPGEIMWVKYSTPQGDTMIRGTSDPNLMPYRFQRQFYSTVVYGVEERTAPSKDPSR